MDNKTNRYFYLSFSLIMLFLLSGCATTTIEGKDLRFGRRKNFLSAEFEGKDKQVKRLTRALEQERVKSQRLTQLLKDRDKKISILTKQLRKKGKPVALRYSAKPNSKTYHLYVIQVQAALKEAGFDVGAVDGKLGSRTRAALKKFQKANGLTPNGRIDKVTWGLLCKHL